MVHIENGLVQVVIYPSMLSCCIEEPYFLARIRQKHNEVDIVFPVLVDQINAINSAIITFSFYVTDDISEQDLPNSIVFYKDWEGTIDIFNVENYDVDINEITSCPCYSDLTSRYISNSSGTSHNKNPFYC